MVKIKHPPRGVKRKHDDMKVSDQQTPDVKPSENRESPGEIKRDEQGDKQQAINRGGTVLTAQEPQVIGRTRDRRRSKWTRTNRISRKVLRMVDIMYIVYGMLERCDKISLMMCSSTSLRIGAQAEGLRRSQDERWLSDWDRPRIGLEALAVVTPGQNQRIIDEYRCAARQLTMRRNHWPADVEVPSILRTYPLLDRVTFVTDRTWRCTISFQDGSPPGLEMVPWHSLIRVSGTPLIDPRFGIAGSHPSLAITSIVVSHDNIQGSGFFGGLLHGQTVTALGNQVFGSILRFGFLDLPGVYHQTLSSMLAAMPRLQHLHLTESKNQSADLAAAIEAFRVHCPALQSLTLDLPWNKICDLTKPQVLNDAGASENTPAINISSWLPHLHISTRLRLSRDIQIQSITQRSLELKWGGDQTKKVVVSMNHNSRFDPADIAIELRYNLPWCDIEVRYQDSDDTGERTSRHLAEVNRLLEKKHYISMETLTAQF